MKQDSSSRSNKKLLTLSFMTKRHETLIKADKIRSERKVIALVVTLIEKFARMAKLADALDLGSSGAIHGGSSPPPSTKKP